MVFYVDANGQTVLTKNTVPSSVDTAVKVQSPNVRYTNDYIEAEYEYQNAEVERHGNVYNVIPRVTHLTLRTERRVPKLGLMMVGWGGNNGSTVTATILANRMNLTWHTKDGLKNANYLGSITQSSTVSLGVDSTTGEEVYVPMKDLLPMVNPNDLVLDGWDISSLDLADAMSRAKVLDWEVQQQLRPLMKGMKPRPGIYDSDFIAANQEERADSTIKGTKWEQVKRIQSDIADFKAKSGADKVVIMWTANTERFCNVEKGLNDTADNLLASIKADKAEISPSTLYAVAAILEGCSYMNGSPQNTFVPGCLELAERHRVFIGGDDFKSGQTKLKSVLVDFLVGAGIKPRSIVSYNHLGNNDGKNLSAPAQFKSKEISKSNVVDDMVASNSIMFKPNETPDHCVVIKYVPYVGDSKRAMDEYTSELMMGGHNTLVIHNTCEDSLLASPIILDLAVLTELCERIRFKVRDQESYQPFHPVLSILAYLCKAPLVPPGTPVVNALPKQRACIENVLRACLGLAPVNHMGLEHKLNLTSGLLQKEKGLKVVDPDLKAGFVNGIDKRVDNKVL